jgi:hypothetical protein
MNSVKTGQKKKILSAHQYGDWLLFSIPEESGDFSWFWQELLTNGPFGVLLISFCLLLLKMLILDNQ